MRAVGFNEPLPIDHPSSLLDVVVDVPTISGREILVQIKANAVNPVDFKPRLKPVNFTSPPKILGLDASGVVVAVGLDVTLFRRSVLYVWTLKPSSLSFGDAAALPLTTMTAYDSIFIRLGVSKKDLVANKSVLILNGSGGVGSIAIQLLKELTDVTVIMTVTSLQLHHVVNHAEDIPKQLAAAGIPQVDYILVFTELPPYFDAIVQVIKPQGKICAITPIKDNLPFQNLFFKSVTFVWETLTTRHMLDTDDLIVHRHVLTEVRDLVDAKRLRSIVVENLGVINAANLKKAHAALEGRRVVGKLVLTGF
ncbi:unnamed protein product [Aphanomyces euteiches]